MAIAILSEIQVEFEPNDMNQDIKYLEDINRTKRLKARSDVIGRFILIVNPWCMENINNSGFNINRHKEYGSTLMDWEFSSKVFLAENAIRNKIITDTEGSIFNTLGDLIEKRYGAETLIFPISGKFKELYYAFFENGDPIKKINKLPN